MNKQASVLNMQVIFLLYSWGARLSSRCSALHSAASSSSVKNEFHVVVLSFSPGLLFLTGEEAVDTFNSHQRNTLFTILFYDLVILFINSVSQEFNIQKTQNLLCAQHVTMTHYQTRTPAKSYKSISTLIYSFTCLFSW